MSSLRWIVRVCTVMLVMTMSATAYQWLSVQDADGITWARITFVNHSSEASNWAVWNCRTAVDSDADWAETDALSDWDGIVEAGVIRYVWVYGYLDGDVYIANTDGDESSHMAAATLDAAGNAEWVVTIAADRTVTSELLPVQPYSAPAQAGDLPEPPEYE